MKSIKMFEFKVFRDSREGLFLWFGMVIWLLGFISVICYFDYILLFR